jgi:hypothetical protein
MNSSGAKFIATQETAATQYASDPDLFFKVLLDAKSILQYHHHGLTGCLLYELKQVVIFCRLCCDYQHIDER